MAKSIIVCMDGTWNTSEADRHGDRRPQTNVRKLFEALSGSITTLPGDKTQFFIELNELRDPSTGTPSQLGIYVEGVGTQLFRLFSGGAIGEGIFDQVVGAYRVVAERYQPDDTLYLTGFSRGAYAARALSGMLGKCGIVRADRLAEGGSALLRGLFNFYRGTVEPGVQAIVDRQCYPGIVRWLGVWDTVGALGLPVDIFNPPLAQALGWLGHVNGVINGAKCGFLDVKLGTNVQHAYQALALDELRKPFVPTLWEEPPPAGVATLEQVWFAGAHADVGGGYAQVGLSNIALRWMVGKLLQPGNTVALDAALLGQYTENASDMLHDSARDMFKDLAPGLSARRVVPANARIHRSVQQRTAGVPGYSPPNLPTNPTFVD